MTFEKKNFKSKFNYFKYCKRVVRLFSRPSEDDTIEELEICYEFDQDSDSLFFISKIVKLVL